MPDTDNQDIHETGPEAQPSTNRYILAAALAFAALVAIYIVKTNLEAPKTEEVAATQDANSRIIDEGQPAGAMDSTAQREQLMHQIEHIQEIVKKDSTNFDAWSALAVVQRRADRIRDVRRRQPRQRHLIQQRLEQEVVLAIDDRHLDAAPLVARPEHLRRRQPAKAGADDHHPFASARLIAAPAPRASPRNPMATTRR